MMLLASNLELATLLSIGLCLCQQIGIGHADGNLSTTEGKGRSLQAYETSNSGALRGFVGEQIANMDNPWMEREPKCEDFDGDICSCVFHGCSVDIGGGERCVPNQKDCSPRRDFWPTKECMRANSFYSNGGIVCHNVEAKGNCSVDLTSKSNYAVNLNGLVYKDRNQVNYANHNSTAPPSPNVPLYFRNASMLETSVCKRDGTGNVANVQSYRRDFSEYDKRSVLFTYIVGGSHNPDQCLEFNIPILEDGVYELDIRSAEMENYHAQFRRFTVKLNDVKVFPEVDVFGLVGRKCFSANLMVNFVVHEKRQDITIRGFKRAPLIKNFTTILAFCPSACPAPVLDPLFIANSISINKMASGGSQCFD